MKMISPISTIAIRRKDWVKLPDLADGDAWIEEVMVGEGIGW
ncbi:MAG: hypothetical protein M5U34_22295 [Chloroflexi bacterium]|nr:hypothetical protein [Chloroflexota bacterium]